MFVKNEFQYPMITKETFREIALSLPDTTEAPHFDKTSFRTGKKIFATLDVNNLTACLKLSLIDQNVFSVVNKLAVYPVPNKWGLQGWTNFELKKLKKSTMIDALTTAYYNIQKKNKRI
jgi:hypothetical protein